MKIHTRLLTSVMLGFVTQIANALDGAQINTSALIGDYVTSNKGLETVVPYWYPSDSDGDGKFDGQKFHFDVYALGTTKKLFSTPDQFFKTYIEDLGIIASGYNFNNALNIDIKRIANTIILSAATYDVDESFGGNRAIYIYAVDLSVAGNTAWYKTYTSGQGLIGTGILPDINGNGIGELSVTMWTYKFSLTGAVRDTANMVVYVYDGKTGESLAAPKTYPMQR